jgi:hypothetical protein
MLENFIGGLIDQAGQPGYSLCRTETAQHVIVISNQQPTNDLSQLLSFAFIDRTSYFCDVCGQHLWSA